jgi:hypothetical protein
MTPLVFTQEQVTLTLTLNPYPYPQALSYLVLTPSATLTLTLTLALTRTLTLTLTLIYLRSLVSCINFAFDQHRLGVQRNGSMTLLSRSWSLVLVFGLLGPRSSVFGLGLVLGL